ncbi:DUF2637 domain-containing protein [Sphaerisporangium sp. NPDC051011]|uniref:DUF2637 domain-containing protein n=1 Tax=Sphaerisporangium sp. NPDC051011 TaxID=3155792 RepID=UPI00340D4D92
MCASQAERWIRWTTTVTVLLLAAIAAVVSCRHMYELAVSHGEGAWTAALVPLSVDGMIVASSMSLLLRSRAGLSGGWLAWFLLVAGSLASLGANVAAAEPTLIGRVIAAWPSFALIGAYEMLMGQIRAYARTPARVEEPGPGAGETGLVVTAELLDLSQGQDLEDSEDEHGSDVAHLHRAAWRWALANRQPDGSLPSGTLIARRFGRSPRWGRWIKNAGLGGGIR